MNHSSRSCFAALLLAAALTGSGIAAAQEPVREIDVAAATAKVREGFSPNGPSLSPFFGMRQAGEALEVQFEGDPVWYRWESLDGLRAVDIRAVCEGAFEGNWWKRITEDLPAVLVLMGQDGEATVDLGIFDPEAERVVVKRDVAMTGENRRRLWHVNQGRDVDEPDRTPSRLAREDWQVDLDLLRELIAERFSYQSMRGVDPEDVFAVERAALEGLAEDGELSRDQFARGVQRIVTRFGDGHAGIQGFGSHLGERGWLPFLVEQVDGGRLVAIRADRGGFVDPEHPFLVELDGRDVEEWIGLRSEFETVGSPQLVRRRSVRGLRAMPMLRELEGHARSRQVVVKLVDAGGNAVTRQVELAGPRERPTYGAWPRIEERFRIVAGGIGVLRVDQMEGDAAFLAEIDAAMARAAAETQGLVIDVRGNGGGTRDVLYRVLPWLLAADEPAVVVNVAAARLGAIPRDLQGPEMLGNRALYPADWKRWSDAARDAIARTAASFAPSWDLPSEGYSDWRYCVVERSADQPRYAHPVVVLMDHDCFSATDIFLGAMQGRAGVTLVGTPSGGGSARSNTHHLPHSKLRLRLGTIASFRPDGTAYDGVGITPDVVVWPAPEDFIGPSDHQLDRALELLRAR